MRRSGIAQQRKKRATSSWKTTITAVVFFCHDSCSLTENSYRLKEKLCSPSSSCSPLIWLSNYYSLKKRNKKSSATTTEDTSSLMMEAASLFKPNTSKILPIYFHNSSSKARRKKHIAPKQKKCKTKYKFDPYWRAQATQIQAHSPVQIEGPLFYWG